MGIGKWEGFKPAEIILSIIALLAIFWLVDAQRILEIILTTNLLFFATALCAYSATVLVMTFRIRYILANLHDKIGYDGAFWANMGGLLASDFTPARTGYFITPLILSRNSGIPVERGMVAIVSPQIPEFFLKALGAGAAIMMIAYAFPELSGNVAFLWAGVGVMMAFCAAMSVALFVPAFVGLVSRFKFIPFVPEGIEFLTLLQSHREKVKGIFLQIILLSLAIFVLKGFEWYFFGQSLGIAFNADYPALLIFMVLQPLVTVFQFAPIPTVAGLGLAEGSAVASMAILGVPAEVAIAYALLVRGGTVLVNSIGITQIVPFLFKKEKQKPEEASA